MTAPEGLAGARGARLNAILGSVELGILATDIEQWGGALQVQAMDCIAEQGSIEEDNT